jgi:hypothetical protein
MKKKIIGKIATVSNSLLAMKQLYEIYVSFHRNQQYCMKTIEIGLEHASFVVLVYFFPHLNKQKTC